MAFVSATGTPNWPTCSWGQKAKAGFQKVATATGSPLITAPVSLGTLWASLPDLAQVGTLPGSPWRIPLELSDERFQATRPRATLYLPGEMPDEPDSWMTAFQAMVACYPSAAGWAIPVEDGRIQITRRSDHQWEVTLRWPAKEALDRRPTLLAKPLAF
jgi:hypothetical protein